MILVPAHKIKPSLHTVDFGLQTLKILIGLVVGHHVEQLAIFLHGPYSHCTFWFSRGPLEFNRVDLLRKTTVEQTYPPGPAQQ